MKTERKPGENSLPSWHFLNKEGREGKQWGGGNREKITLSGCFQVDNNVDQKCVEGGMILLMLNTHTYIFAFKV